MDESLWCTHVVEQQAVAKNEYMKATYNNMDKT